MKKLDNAEKDTIEYIVAICVILFGCILTVMGFLAPPVGEIHPTVITVLGELLIFSGAIFHLNLSFKRKDEEFRGEIRNELNGLRQRIRGNETNTKEDL